MNGESHDGRGRSNRIRGLSVVATTVLLLAFLSPAAYPDDQEYPVTASEAARMNPPAPSSATNTLPPVTGESPKYYDPAALMMSAPTKTAPPVAVAPPPARIASAPAVAVPAASPWPLIAEPAATSSPMEYSAIPPVSSPPEIKEPDALERPTYAVPVVPQIEGRGDSAQIASPEMQEIPQAAPSLQPRERAVAMTPPPPQNLPPPPEVEDLHAYMHYDASPLGMGRPGDIVTYGEEISPIGLEMREAHRRLKTGETTGGLLIVKVAKDSAAARAGLRPFKRAGHTVLEGVAIGAAMIFPPAILAVPVIDYSEVGESYDMIIGVDGTRVCNVLDFEDQMRNVQPGETVYFNVVRDGQRIQIPVLVPAVTSQAYTAVNVP